MAGFDERDDLNAPLGLGPQPRPSRLRASHLALAAAVAAIGGFAALVARTSAPFGGEPFAVAVIDPLPAAPASAPAPVAAAPVDPATIGSIISAAQQIEGANGVKVTRAGGAGPPNALIISVPEALGVQLSAAPDKRLVEKSRYGMLPRVGTDGTRPADFYARPVMTAAKLKGGAPRIAILLGGVGLSLESTAAAIHTLPGAISLAFAPYGTNVEHDAADARQAGHETFLQAPMEPIDYPASNPGAHTLLTSASAAENIDHLHWLMSRFTGFAGVTNFLGAKFTASSDALAPVLNEIAQRGLSFIDDGSSPRSLTRDVAASVKLPATTADVVLDANQAPQAISEALTRLETIARTNGAALGVAAALPLSIEQIARWSQSLESRGIALVPASALVGRGPGAAAKAEP
jgi:polysaccharide deacetylase 2 family uncharacterized protein YibQ